MTQNVPLDKGQTAVEPFFDATQELLGAAAPHLYLTTPSANTVRAAAGSGNDQQSVAVNGRYRFRTSNVDATVSGAAGTYEIYVTASNNNFTGPPEDIDQPTDYNFGLVSRAVGSPPVGVDQYRKVAEVDWSGSAITALRQLVGLGNASAPLRPTAALPTITPLIVRGATSQSADILRVENVSGTKLMGLGPTGALTVTSVASSVYTAAGAITFVTGGSIVTSLASNGDLTLVGKIIPGGRATWANPTNLTIDRSYNANATTINELADIVGTIINDLRAVGVFA